MRQRRVGVTALFRTEGRRQAVCAEHGRIMTALAGDDPDAAAKAIDEHLQLTLRVLLRA